MDPGTPQNTGKTPRAGSDTGKSEVQAAILTVKFIPRSLCRWSSRLSTPHLSPVPHSGSDPLFHPHFAPFSRTLNLPKFITKFIPKSLMLTFVQTVAFTHRASLSADSQVLPVSAAAHHLQPAHSVSTSTVSTTSRLTVCSPLPVSPFLSSPSAPSSAPEHCLKMTLQLSPIPQPPVYIVRSIGRHFQET